MWKQQRSFLYDEQGEKQNSDPKRPLDILAEFNFLGKFELQITEAACPVKEKSAMQEMS